MDVWEVGEVWESQSPFPEEEPDEYADAEAQHRHGEAQASH